MTKKKKIRLLVFFIVLMALVGMGIILTNGLVSKSETIQEVMKDAVLHDTGKVSLFGIKDVNPALISAFTITVVILIVALVIRIVVVPKFKIVPGKFQLLLEQWVGYFNKLAISNSPEHHKFLSVYLFVAGSYVFISTLFELFGLQAINTHGASITLPAPLADINAAIAMGVMSYLVILGGGIAANGLKGAGQTLKDFSLPISMSFRLFGALLSGLLVNELVYYSISLSFVLPVIVAVLFTLLHALIQCYVLTMLVALFYGEVSEKKEEVKK